MSTSDAPKSGRELVRLAVIVGALGVVFGDIGTSPIYTIQTVTEPVPRVASGDRIVIDDLGYADDGITHVSAKFGYMETPDVPAALKTLDPAKTEGPLQVERASYFLSKIELRRGPEPTMAGWRKRLFIATSYITADAAEYFVLPRENTVIMGSHISL